MEPEAEAREGLIVGSRSGPACRACCVSRPEKRAPNRATHWCVDVLGVSTLTCRMHTEMLVKAGGFAWQLSDLPPLWVATMSTDQLMDRLQMASIARREPRPAPPALGVDGSIVIKVDADGVRITGLPSG